MVNRIELEYKEKLIALSSQQKMINKEIHSLHFTQQEVGQEIQTLSKNSMVEKANDLLENLKRINNRASRMEINKFSLDFVSKIVPEFDCETLVLQPYSILQKNSFSAYIYSEILANSGFKWRLKVYPNGYGVPLQGKWISVFLEMVEVNYYSQ